MAAVVAPDAQERHFFLRVETVLETGFDSNRCAALPFRKEALVATSGLTWTRV
jgi:hypothetical protein